MRNLISVGPLAMRQSSAEPDAGSDAGDARYLPYIEGCPTEKVRTEAMIAIQVQQAPLLWVL